MWRSYRKQTWHRQTPPARCHHHPHDCTSHSKHNCVVAGSCFQHACAVSLTLDHVWLPQLIQYAKHVGIKTINLVRRQEQVQQLEALG